jgi:hypothetical protein
VWQAGALVIYDANLDNVYNTGDTIVAQIGGISPAIGLAGFKADALIRWVPSGTETAWIFGDTVVRDTGNTHLFAAADPLIAPTVFGWQFAINYDPTLVVPQADPAAVPTYPDGADATAKVGSVAAGCPVYGGAAGGCNWNSALVANQASLVFTITTPGKAFVAFTFLNPHSPVITNNVVQLGSIAFEIIKPTAPTMALTVSDVKIVDINAVTIPQ